MKLAKLIGLGVLGLLVLLVALSFVLPRTARVERSVVIAAPPATVFAVLNGYRQFNRWSPWADKDPRANYAYEGPAAGVGARMRWSGNKDVGSGAQEIIESTPYTKIRARLELADFPGSDNQATYTLTPEGAATRVRWTLDVDNKGSLIARWFGLLMDGMVGPDYEKGLTRLKTLVETLPKTDFSDLPLQITDATPLAIAYVTTSSAMDDRALGVALGVAYGRISGFMDLNAIKQAAPPVALFQPAVNGVLHFDAGIPVDRSDVAPPAGIKFGKTFGGAAVKAVYRGPYSGLVAAHEKIAAFLAAAGYKPNGPTLEQYVTDPATTPDVDLITHIYYPIE